MEIQSDILHGLAGAKGAFNICASLKIAGLHANIGVAAAGLVMAIIQHFIEIAIQFKGDTFAKFVYVDHAFTFLSFCEIGYKRRDYTREYLLDSKLNGWTQKQVPHAVVGPHEAILAVLSPGFRQHLWGC